ncbi:hypothetical protein KFL_004750010 [Klebsormidium nitens]|uniref:Uncharacterized protein n=1 Tax=Klebsormidium nitens TaxID=105231 RepID=A0A1Y1IFZ3_KLENI|nr:hypothetical protein KFL_004750010 [Klebsormidium nitens]|eukprot:GAQ88972.1 hypothetical protein KFL_004750010 [Klebsormidium nitens]
MISSVCWVPKGAAKTTPITVDPTEEELEAMKAAALKAQETRGEGDEDSSDEEDEWEEDDENEEEEEGGMEEEADPAEQARAVAAALGGGKGKRAAKKSTDALAAGLAELDMDNYDQEDEQADTERLFGNGGLGNAQYISSEDDPYITLKGDDDSEEIDDFTIRDSDLLLLTARNEDDVSNIEVWVYEEAQGDEFDNLYVHHDIMLPAFPLALAWMDCNPAATAADPAASKGNMVAVGTLMPEIEIWDLDVLDAVEPVQTLGGYEEEGTAAEDEPTSEDGKKKKKSKKKKKRNLKEGSHTDSVLGLAWNAEFRNVLASCSADTTIKAWDITTGKCEHTLTHHTDKVQTVVWNPAEPTVLLSGGFDKMAAVIDMRSPQQPALTWQVSADVECAAWDPHAPQYFVVSTEDGLVRCHDVRKGRAADGASSSGAAGEGALFTLAAHDKPTCSVSYNPAVPNFLATGSTDKMVKLWDTTGHRPAMLASKNPKVGAVFSVSFCKDAPHLLANGGSKGELNVWGVLDTAAVARRFPTLGPQRTKREKPAEPAEIEED